MASWNVVGCWTGRSAGLAPLRILSDVAGGDANGVFPPGCAVAPSGARRRLSVRMTASSISVSVAD
jgi:hypothetical protein